MFDVSFLSGACVRDQLGHKGRFLGLSGREASILWETPGSVAGRKETFHPNDDRLRYRIEVLSLSAGWVLLDQVLPKFEAVQSWKSPLSEAQSVHNPFRNKERLGPGPRGQLMQKRRRWKCAGSDYEYTCTGQAPDNKGRKIKIKVNRAWKAAYNRDYKRLIKFRGDRR